MTKIAVVAIHGMGAQSDGFSDGLRDRIRSRLERTGHDSDRMVWKEILWSNLVEPRERKYLEAAENAGPLSGFFGFRRFVVSALGDATAYQATSGRPTSTYSEIHDRIRERIGELYETGLGSEPVPMMVLAHSLGSHIISNYIWDTQHKYPTGALEGTSTFERMEWLTALVTFGSNIPLFTFAFDPVEPLRFPGNALPEDVAAKATWRNYYDRHDVLGYPLRPLSEAYAEAVDDDIEINVGPIVLSSTPLSHSKYWTDGSFVNEAAAVVARFL